MRRIAGALLMLVGMPAFGSTWHIELSDDMEGDEGGCWARWDADGFTVQITENNQTDQDRLQLGLPTHRPVLRWTFDSTSEEPPSPRYDEQLPLLQARLYPDGGQGFVDLNDDNSTIHEDLWEGEWRDSRYRWMLQWTDFPVERLRTWAVANDPQATANVTLPEVRLILKWTDTRRGSFEDYEVERYVDVPLWRTANVVNKLERCSCTMRRSMESAKCWDDG